MPLTRTAVIWTLSAVAAGAVLVTGGAVWALTSGPAAPNHAGNAASSSAAPGTVPPLYTGDELEWLLLPNDQLASLLGATDIKGYGSRINDMGDWGIFTDPAPCVRIVTTDYTGVIGSRTANWTIPGGRGEMATYQFPTKDQANEWFTQTRDAIPGCGNFVKKREGDKYWRTYESMGTLVEATNDQANALVVEQKTASATRYVGSVLRAYSVHGNVIVVTEVTQNFLELSGDPLAFDQQKLADALIAQAESAHERLKRELG